MTAYHLATYPRAMVFPLDAVPIGASHHLIDGAVAAHRHMFVEIAVVLGGSGQHVAASGFTMAQPGDVFVLHPGTWHAYNVCQHCAIMNCYFGAELLDHELAWLRAESAIAPLLPRAQPHQHHATARLSAQGCEQYQHVIGQLIQRTQNLRPATRIECLGLLTSALGILAQAWELLPTTPCRRAIHPAVSAGQQMLNDQLDFPWTLGALAYQLHIDRSYLVRLFKQHTGLAPMAFLARRRAERAAVLLRTTRQPIATIGTVVGWDDPNQFNRRFKACFGVNASTYRARNAAE